MCVAIVSLHQLAEWPVFIAANRDEAYDRPSEPPRLDREGHVTILAPRDLRCGGAWIGVNEHRVFAVITNRSDQGEAPSGVRSRGLLVVDVLRAGNLKRALATVDAHAGTPSAPFNLIVGSPLGLSVIERTTDRTRIRRLRTGTIVVTNMGAPDDPTIDEVKRAQQLWGQLSQDRVAPEEAARQILTARGTATGEPPLLTRNRTHGTVASTILGIDSKGGIHFRHAHGPPDRVPYESYEFPER